MDWKAIAKEWFRSATPNEAEMHCACVKAGNRKGLPWDIQNIYCGNSNIRKARRPICLNPLEITIMPKLGTIITIKAKCVNCCGSGDAWTRGISFIETDQLPVPYILVPKLSYETVYRLEDAIDGKVKYTRLVEIPYREVVKKRREEFECLLTQLKNA